MEYGIAETVRIELDGEVYLGRPLPAPRIEALERKHTRRKVEDGKVYTEFNPVAFGRENFLETLTGWEGLTRDGQPWPFSQEAAAWLYDYHVERAGQILVAFNTHAAAVREASRKNSSASPEACGDGAKPTA